MIIQIKDTSTKQWMNRASCKTQEDAEKEVENLKKIYRFNEFQIVEGEDSKVPGPKYKDKSDSEIAEIVKGVDGLIRYKGIKNAAYMEKMAKVLMGSK